MTERLHFQFSLSCIGEGNGNPLQSSCLENPRDGGAWWAAVSGVAQSWTQLKRLSGSSSKHGLSWGRAGFAVLARFYQSLVSLCPLGTSFPGFWLRAWVVCLFPALRMAFPSGLLVHLILYSSLMPLTCFFPFVHLFKVVAARALASCDLLPCIQEQKCI